MAGNVRIRLRLSEIIKARGMTQKEFAAQVGLSANTVSNLVHDPSKLNIRTMEKLVDYGITFDELFEIEESRS